MRPTNKYEQRRHGRADFPLQHYHMNIEDPRYIMVAHWHREMEFIYVSQGQFEVFLDNVPYLLRQGDFLLVEGGCLHRGQPQSCTYECLIFDPAVLLRQQNDALQKMLLPLADCRFSTRLFSKEHPDIKQTLGRLFAASQKHTPFFEMEVCGLLFLLFSQLYTAGYIESSPALPTHSMHAMQTLLTWLEQNYAEPVTLQTLSELSGLNEKYLCRLFKQYTCKSPMQYLQELRLENACYDMTALGKSVTAAAYDNGFGDLSYFCKLFKRYKGITPREYRQSTKI